MNEDKKWIFKSKVGSGIWIIQGTAKHYVRDNSGFPVEVTVKPIKMEFPRETLSFVLTEKVAQEIANMPAETLLELIKKTRYYNRDFKLVYEPGVEPTNEQKEFSESVDKKAEARGPAVISGTRSLAKNANKK